MVWLILKGFINFYNKRNAQKIANKQENTEGPASRGV